MFTQSMSRTRAHAVLERVARPSLTACLALLLVGLGGLMSGCTPPGELNLPSDAKALCTVNATEFAGWFENGSVSLDGVVTPADSVNFANTPNCSFYQWSEHMYLWLTSPAPVSYGGGGGRIFDSSAFFDVSPRDASGHRKLTGHTPGTISSFRLRAAQAGVDGLKVVLSKSGKMFEVIPPVRGPHGQRMMLDAQGQNVEIKQVTLDREQRPRFIGLDGNLIERPRPILPKGLRDKNLLAEFDIKGLKFFIDALGNLVPVEQGQAGGNGVLEAQNQSLIYYASMVNDVYAYFLTGVKDGDLPSPGGNPMHAVFPTSQPELDAITAFASSHGRSFPDPQALAVEIKTSWIDASVLSDPGDYITMKAKVPVYDRSDANHWVRTGETTKTLAMVGIHVVGSTAGHPEMIWATFEHKGATPDAAYDYVDAGGSVKTVAQDTSGQWLFTHPGSAGPFNQQHMSYDPATNTINATPGFTVSPSDTLRANAWGAAAGIAPNPLANTARSNTEIISINNSVRGQLASGDVRGNYIMTGATWTIGGSPPSGMFPSGNEVGTSRMANTTMETYQSGTNCFSCHQSSFGSSQSTVAVSHLFPDIDPLF